MAVEAIPRFEKELLISLETDGQAVLDAIRTEKALTETVEPSLKDYIVSFKKGFVA